MSNLSPTEKVYTKSEFIDNLSTKLGLELMLNEQALAVSEVKKNIKELIRIVHILSTKLKNSNSSRIFYVGAGTSGRIGLQDGVELYPTFGWPLKRLGFLIAGGKKSITKAVEDAEDNVIDAKKQFFKNNINQNDIVIGLAASGNTPFTCKILELSFNIGAFTIAISNNPLGKILEFGKGNLILDTRQEVIAGSTRLKAGTAQKICLNIISSMVMTKLGFVKNGRMNNLVATNQKLRKRQTENEKEYKKQK